jgi:hypothetical protein
MSRKIFRAYAQANGKEAKEFVELQSNMYEHDTLITKSNDGSIEATPISYKQMLFWLFKNFKIESK